MQTDEVLDLIDNLRVRNVQTFRMKRADGFELELVVPPLIAGELPESVSAREKMLRDPSVPEDVKRRIREEDDRDLYASA